MCGFYSLESVIDDLQLLERIKQATYCDNDVRATWIGHGVPKTNVERFSNFAKFALEHLNMYIGFLTLDEIFKLRHRKLRILDIACGTGFATRYIADFFGESLVEGVDLSRHAVDFAIEHNPDSRISYVNQDMFEYDDGKFDLIFFLETFEHLNYPKNMDVLERFLSSLRVGGLLCFTTPNNSEDFGDHSGVLKPDRFGSFYSKFNERMLYSGFYSNELLCDVSGKFSFLIEDSLLNFRKDKRSHFRVLFS